MGINFLIGLGEGRKPLEFWLPKVFQGTLTREKGDWMDLNFEILNF